MPYLIKPATRFIFTCLFILTILFVQQSCNKIDLSQKENAEITGPSPNFFDLPANASPALQRIAEAMKALDRKDHFVSSFAKKNGLPVWNKVTFQYTFYTMGVDRTWDWITALLNSTGYGFTKSDELWSNIQSNFKDFINQNSGNANFYSEQKIIVRPKWDDAKDFLLGRISLETLKEILGC